MQFVELDYFEKQERFESIQQELQKSTLYSEVLHCLENDTLSRQDISIDRERTNIS